MKIETVNMRESAYKHSDTNIRIEDYMVGLTEKLIQKNIAYGDSLQNPINVFQKDLIAGILGRLDDKLNRIKSVGINEDTEDSIEDLIGYLIHLRTALGNDKKFLSLQNGKDTHS